METIIDTQMDSVKTYLDRFCGRYGDRDFIRMMVDETLMTRTYRELYRDSLSLANGLIEQGFTGKHIAIISENRYEFIVTFFGCLLAGCTLVLINTGASEKIPEMLAFSDADAVIVTQKTAPVLPMIRSNCCGVKVFFSFDPVEGCKTLPQSDVPAPCYYGDFSSDDAAVFCFTSGTSSGKPKCVMLRAGGLFSAPKHNIYRFISFMGENKQAAKVYSPLPLFHLAGLISVVMLVCIPSGCTYMTSASIGDNYKDIRRLEPVYVLTVPALAETLCGQIEEQIVKSGRRLPVYDPAADRADVYARYEDDISAVCKGLRAMTLCGAKSPDELVRRLNALGIHAGCEYGMTECSPEVTIAATKIPLRIGSVGVVCSFNEAKIVDGILYLRGENIMKGYYKNPEATKEVLSPDGWLCTGDLAEIDADGYLFIKGRANSVVVLSNGDNVDTDELAAMFTSAAAIREIVILADKKNNNDTLAALIYPADGAAHADVEETVREVNKTLPMQKRVARFRLVDKPFEKNEMMKIKRFLYRDEVV